MKHWRHLSASPYWPSALLLRVSRSTLELPRYIRTYEGWLYLEPVHDLLRVAPNKVESDLECQPSRNAHLQLVKSPATPTVPRPLSPLFCSSSRDREQVLSAMAFNVIDQPSLYAWQPRQAGGEGSSGKSSLKSMSNRLPPL